VTIGERVLTGPNLCIYGATHPLDPAVRRGIEGQGARWVSALLAYAVFQLSRPGALCQGWREVGFRHVEEGVVNAFLSCR
jgi:hypothetical protein